MKNKIYNRPIYRTPGLYTKEINIGYSPKSLGKTAVGLVGETLKGPAFQLINLNSWTEYEKTFGGTSPELFVGSKYPKYELPYIAKDYLSESNNLTVVRVLGLSGVNAGPAWAITVSKYDDGNNLVEDAEYNDTIVAIIRSRGNYKKASLKTLKDGVTNCEDVYEFDKIQYYAKEVYIEKNKSFNLSKECTPRFSAVEENILINPKNYGRFTLVVRTYNDEIKRYSVSLNAGEKDYIYNVIGTNPQVGDSEIFIEELYDIALKQLIEKGEVNAINFVNPAESLQIKANEREVSRVDSEAVLKPIFFKNVNIVPKFKSVNDILSKDEGLLRRNDLGKRFIYSKSESINSISKQPLKVHVSEDKGVTWKEQEGKVGHIYTVIGYTTSTGQKEYYYGEYVNKIGLTPNDNQDTLEGNYRTEFLQNIKNVNPNEETLKEAVEVLSDNIYYIFKGEDIAPVTFDINNYKESFRNAITPWVLSEIKGSNSNIELHKLFRFHTISDGANSNYEVKVSIEKIDPTKGTFDVIVRDFFDNDNSPIVLERFHSVNLVEGSKSYIGAKIGTLDGKYRGNSNYITVEINETEKLASSIPSGFMGYPMRDYYGAGNIDGKKVKTPYIKYNTEIDNSIKIQKQYFGLSDKVGIDTDVLKYKGVEAYIGTPRSLSPSFHLDSRILTGKPNKDGYVLVDEVKQKVTIDGIGGYEFISVNRNNVTSFGIEPRIGGEDLMLNTIYENIEYRKFTIAFYGGFDGWDYYRGYRTNTNEFNYKNYKGGIDINGGAGDNFSFLKNPESLDFSANVSPLNTDWYAYLGGINLLSNPKMVDINILATPGIDIINHSDLVAEVVEMVEEKRGDCIYIPTLPDKPMGANDTKFDAYSADSIVDLLEDTEIESTYVATYFPWVKYQDKDNNVNIFLPITKDVLRNMAYTDNMKHAWYATAGMERGTINGIEPRYVLKSSEAGDLYEGRINYVERFEREGLKIWGDKNLSKQDIVLNRLSKRRLMIELKKSLNLIGSYLLFNPNDLALSKTLNENIENILKNFISKRAISDYKVVIDDSPEMRDMLMIQANIFIKPIGALEFIELNITVTPQGVSFDKLV